VNTTLALIYFAILIAALLAPFLARFSKEPIDGGPPRLSLIAYIAVGAAGWILLGRTGFILPLMLLIVTPLLAKKRPNLLGSLIAFLLFTPAMWWEPNLLALPRWQILLFLAFAAASVAAYQFAKKAYPLIDAAERHSIAPFFIASTVLALAVGWYSAPFNADVVAHTAWHHWGAYLSPVDLLLSGAVPYHDFPVQYGMGATILLSASCGADCWNGMFYVVLVANALYCGTFAACAAIVTSGAGRANRGLAFLAMFAATMLWTAFGGEFGGTMSTPSVAGLRFQPLVAMLLFILWYQQRAGRSLWFGHAIWLFNIFWSVESAIFATLLWCPWLAYRSLAPAETLKKTVANLSCYAAFAIVGLVSGTLALLLLYRASFGFWPEPTAIAAYFQNPPGPLTPYLLGPVVLFFVVALLAIFRLLKDELPTSNMLYPCLIAMMVVFTYYLSRSHDNNILNLFPFILLVGLCMLRPVGEKAEPDTQFSDGFSTVLAMSMVVFITTFNFTHWQEGSSKGRLFDNGPNILMRQFSPPNSDANPVIAKDAQALLNLARKNSDYAPIFFDDKAIMPRGKPGIAWNSVNNIPNYSALPMPLVQQYLQRSAAHFQRSGWLIIGDGKYENWQNEFKTAYVVKLVERKGKYVAYSLTPKNPKTRPKS
jgi:hypothetical protein